MVKAMHVLSPLWFLTASQQSYYYTTTATTLAFQKSADAALTAYIVSINGYNYLASRSGLLLDHQSQVEWLEHTNMYGTALGLVYKQGRLNREGGLITYEMFV